MKDKHKSVLDHQEMEVVVQNKTIESIEANNSSTLASGTGVIDNTLVSDSGFIDQASMEITISYETITGVDDDINVNNNHKFRL